jgi:hypothetical protein
MYIIPLLVVTLVLQCNPAHCFTQGTGGHHKQQSAGGSDSDSSVSITQTFSLCTCGSSSTRMYGCCRCSCCCCTRTRECCCCLQTTASWFPPPRFRCSRHLSSTANRTKTTNKHRYTLIRLFAVIHGSTCGCSCSVGHTVWQALAWQHAAMHLHQPLDSNPCAAAMNARLQFKPLC